MDDAQVAEHVIRIIVFRFGSSRKAIGNLINPFNSYVNSYAEGDDTNFLRK